MKKTSIKEDILTTARELFQVKGYNSVTMRDIAAELGISVGNLTYHYKKKEDLVEAVILQKHQYYQKAEPFDTLEDLMHYFKRIAAKRKHNAYYFRHYTQLAQLCPRVYEIQLEVMADMQDTLEKTIDNLIETGIFKVRFDGQIENAIQAIMIICIHGIEYFERLHRENVPEEIMKAVLTVITGLLTEKGWKELDTKGLCI